MKDLGLGILISLGIKGDKELTKTNRGLKDLIALAKKSEGGMKSFSHSIKQYIANLREINKLQDAQNGIKEKLANQFKIGAVGAAALAIPLKIAVDYDSAISDAAKAVNFIGKEKEKFAKEVQLLTGVLPQSAVEIANMAKIAAENGIKKEELTAFTRSAGEMALAFGINANEATNSLAQINSIYGLNVKKTQEFSGAIANLANKAGVSGSRIMDTMQGIGTSARSFGLSEKETAALSTTMLKLGKSPQEASSTIEKLMLTMSNAENGGKKFQATLRKMGIDADYLKYAIKNNASGAIEDFLLAMSQFDKEDQIAAFSDIVGKKEAEDISVLVSGLKDYQSALRAAKDKEAGEAAMQKKLADARAETGYQIKQAKNALMGLGNVVGSVFLPVITDLIRAFTAILRPVADFMNEHKTLTKIIIGGVGAIWALRTATLIWAFVTNIAKIKALGFINTLISYGITGRATGVTTAAMGRGVTLLGTGFLKASGLFKIGAKIIGKAIFGIPIIGWIAMGISLIMELSDAFGGFGNLCKAIWEGLKTLFKWTPLGMVFQLVGGFIDMLGEKFEWVKNLTDSIKNIIDNLAKGIKNFFGGIADFFSFVDNDENEINAEKVIKNDPTYEEIEYASNYQNYIPAASAQTIGGGNVTINFSGNFLIGTDKNGNFNLQDFKKQIVKAVKDALTAEERSAYNRRIAG
ncbi:MAG: phage tail tape measure protein [Campylobacteraceae bacterium]|nr:phage tail tape measure protein [Campylobacteraceae bacterium]